MSIDGPGLVPHAPAAQTDGLASSSRLGVERLGVGIDLVQVSRIAESMRLFGERFTRRLFTPAEIAYCSAAEVGAAERFAARFAAKEAGLKALRLTEGVDWRELEVVRADSGACALHLHGDLARRAGPWVLSVSLSHEGDLATAVVVAERIAPAAAPSMSSHPSHQSNAGPTPSPPGPATTLPKSNPP
jgi:holo-[acyl-carrier protein] synthase